MSNEIKKVNPINSKSPANNYYYNPYNQHSEYKQTDQQQSNMNGDYFEKSIEYPEYNYDSSGNFKETVTSDLKKKSRLKKNNNYNIIPERTENDVRGFIPGLRDPFTIGKPNRIMASPVDGWTEHRAFTGGAIIKDPTRTATYKPNVLG